MQKGATPQEKNYPEAADVSSESSDPPDWPESEVLGCNLFRLAGSLRHLEYLLAQSGRFCVLTLSLHFSDSPCFNSQLPCSQLWDRLSI